MCETNAEFLLKTCEIFLFIVKFVFVLIFCAKQFRMDRQVSLSSSAMLSKSVNGEDDVRKAALTNQLVLRCIFSHLELSDLKRCRLVNKFWGSELGVYIREYRRCFAKTPDCFDLSALNGRISQLTFFEPIINGISINLCHSREESNVSCAARQNAQVFNMLSVKHVEILRKKLIYTCPTVEFAISTILQKLGDMETLTLDYFPGMSGRYFGDDWNPPPVLPKLKILDLGIIHENEELDTENTFLFKVLNRAPNLEKLKGTGMTAKFLNRIPQENLLASLDSFDLSMDGSKDNKKNCLKLAQARPTLSRLSISAPSNSEHMGSFLQVAQDLLTSSCNSLKEFQMNHVNFPFSFLSFPPLLRLKKLIISTQFQSGQRYQQLTAHQLIAVLRSIDYPRMAPSLNAVYIHAEEVIFIREEERLNPWVELDVQAIVSTYPATTVDGLEVMVDFGHLTFQDLSQVFPKLTNLKAATLQMPSIPYGDLWASWPDLKVVHLLDGEDALTRNFDSEFLGINPQEVELLRELDDEALEKLQVVPIRPCVLTMARLKSLKISVVKSWVGGGGGMPHFSTGAQSAPFLSKLTGILAFEKMARMGTKIQIVGHSNKIAYRLHHLRPFASMGYLDRRRRFFSL